MIYLMQQLLYRPPTVQGKALLDFPRTHIQAPFRKGPPQRRMHASQRFILPSTPRRSHPVILLSEDLITDDDDDSEVYEKRITEEEARHK
jgi:hypothetical protein